MIDGVDQQFSQFQEKSGEMKTLIDQSNVVLQETRNVVDGICRALNTRFEKHEELFTEIHSKHAQYDDLVSRRPAQGKGMAKGVWQERAQELIHEKDIKMPFFPEKADSVETFRRWWREVAEYCERLQRFEHCTLVFKRIRGYPQRIAVHDYMDFGIAVNKSR